MDLLRGRLLRRPPLLLGTALRSAVAAPPSASRPHRAALVGHRASGVPPGGRRRDLLPARGGGGGGGRGERPRRTAPAAAAGGPEQGILPPSGPGVARLRSVPGHPHALPVLPAAGGGDGRVWPPCPQGGGPDGTPRRSSTQDPLPALCVPVDSLAVSAAVSARILPAVPCPAARRRYSLSGVEGALPGLVSPKAQLVLSRSARSWTGLINISQADRFLVYDYVH